MLNDMTTGSQPFTVQIRSRGQMTIPRKLRDALSIVEGDTVSLFQIGEVVVLASRPPRAYELADKIVDLMESEGVTLADLLADLPQIRQDIYKERQAPS